MSWLINLGSSWWSEEKNSWTTREFATVYNNREIAETVSRDVSGRVVHRGTTWYPPEEGQN